MRLPGPFVITRVVDLEGVFRDPRFLLPDATPEAFAQTRVSRDPRFYNAATDRLLMSFHSLIVQTPRHRILVDTCVGNDKQFQNLPEWHMRKGSYVADLAAAKLPADSVTHVFCTHLHADHVGWNTMLRDGRWVPTFPNATYVMHRVEVDHARRARAASAEPAVQRTWDQSVQPILDAGQALLVDGDHEIEPGVRLMTLPGHTPGNCALCLDDGHARAFLVGDTIHHPVQIERPHWSSSFCADKAQSAATRAKFLGDVADTGAWVIPAHFMPPTAVQVIGGPAGFWFKTAS
ncbi:MAG: MBL fold metallo-hydrolase [Rhodospirillaceae bacterium]|nr:MBL fold metallo-hydrolase [Rhodospirillaceae bacterium]